MERPKKYLPLKERQKLMLKMLEELKKTAKEKAPMYSQLVDLLIAHMCLLKKEATHIQELYLQVVGHSFSGNQRFLEFIRNSPNENVFGKALTNHNARVQVEFMLSGINLYEWLNFSHKEESEVLEYEAVKDKEGKWAELEEYLEDFLSYLENTPLYGSARKDCIEIEKKKAMIFRGGYAVPEKGWEKFLFPKYRFAVDRFGKNIRLRAEDINESEYNIKMALDSFFRTPKNIKLMVKLWSRDPRFDLFQGNFSNCCIAIGEKDKYPAVHLPEVSCNKFPAGILDYLIDLGIQVAEIYYGKYQVGQCWLYASLDEFGKPVLVVDSFDIALDKRMWKNGMRECMFSFLKKYASACGISKIVIGKEGPLVNTGKSGKIIIQERHEIHNDVSISDLLGVSFQNPLEKLGGYFLGRPYFLETRGGRKAYLVADNLSVNKINPSDAAKEILDLALKFKSDTSEKLVKRAE